MGGGTWLFFVCACAFVFLPFGKSSFICHQHTATHAQTEEISACIYNDVMQLIVCDYCYWNCCLSSLLLLLLLLLICVIAAVPCRAHSFWHPFRKLIRHVCVCVCVSTKISQSFFRLLLEHRHGARQSIFIIICCGSCKPEKFENEIWNDKGCERLISSFLFGSPSSGKINAIILVRKLCTAHTATNIWYASSHRIDFGS